MTQESPTPLQRAEAIATRWGATGSAMVVHIAAAVREAVLAERESCASVADNFRVTDFPPDKRGALRQLRGDIADIIRARPAP